MSDKPQKVANCNAKGHLLACKTWPFTSQKTVFCKAVCKHLKTQQVTNRRINRRKPCLNRCLIASFPFFTFPSTGIEFFVLHSSFFTHPLSLPRGNKLLTFCKKREAEKLNNFRYVT